MLHFLLPVYVALLLSKYRKHPHDLEELRKMYNYYHQNAQQSTVHRSQNHICTAFICENGITNEAKVLNWVVSSVLMTLKL